MASTKTTARLPVVLLATLAIVAVAAGCGIGGDDGAEVILEPTESTGTDPFTDSVATEQVELAGGEVQPISGGSEQVESLAGSEPELYGGTGQEAVCDPEALVSFLDQNGEQAAAFASVVGVGPGKIDRYVAGLTPVVLREDTRVTNHGFSNGEATPFEAVLQAGTAVMVDDRGVPRVRCACGNPLAEPTAVSSAPEFSGDGWEGFDEQRLVAITESDRPIETFELVDVDSGEVYEQAVGGGLTVEELLNLKIPTEVCDLRAVRWENGKHPDSGTPAGNGAPITAEVAGIEGGITMEGELQAAVGDLTRDGAADGVVTTVESCGGNTIFGATYVFGADGKLIARLPDVVNEPGAVFPETHTNLRIVDGGIEMTVMGFTAEDNHADGPSLREQVRFEWNGSEFEAVRGG